MPQLALPPGPSAVRSEPPPFKRERDSADDILTRARALMDEEDNDEEWAGDPGGTGCSLASEGWDSERVAALTAELEAARRVWRSRCRDTAVKARTSEEPAVAPARGLTEQGRAAVESGPPELRERLRNGA